MKTYKVLLMGVLLTTASVARFTPKDIEAEVAAHTRLQETARGLLGEIRDDKRVRIEQVTAPFRAEQEPLNEQIRVLREEINPLYEEQRAICQALSEIEHGKYRKMEELLAPLYVELEVKREPAKANRRSGCGECRR